MRVLWQTFQRKALQRWLCERGTRGSVAVACVVAFALLCSAALALRSMSSGADTLARGRRPVVVFHGKRSCDTFLQVYVCIFCVAFLVSFTLQHMVPPPPFGGDGRHHSFAGFQVVGWGQGPSQLARRFAASGLWGERLGAPVNHVKNFLLWESIPPGCRWLSCRLAFDSQVVFFGLQEPL